MPHRVQRVLTSVLLGGKSLIRLFPPPPPFKHNEKYSGGENSHFIQTPPTSSTSRILIHRRKRKFDESHLEKRQPGSESDKVRGNAFMDERALDEVRQKKERVSAWVRLKTPTHAEPCHTHIRVMDESRGLHNLWAARRVPSAALLNVASPASVPLPLRAR